MWWELAAAGSLALAAGPAILCFRNLAVYRVPRLTNEDLPPLSILIPARNEERGLPDTLTAALGIQGLEFEIVVLDDHSSDRTADIVRDFASRDARVRLEFAPPLPVGWCGKQHACWVLSQRARYDHWLFLDADVRLAPTGAAAALQFHLESEAALVSGVPRQLTVSLLEQLLIPLIHVILLGFLPLDRMRRSTHPAYGAGCGQFFLTDRASYIRSGGHAAIRESLHDGVRLPRAYRQAGLTTDLCDATFLAVCRMYRSSGEVWRGLSKNATEGLAAPGMIVPATLLLLGGQVLPLVWFVLGLHESSPALLLIGSAGLACVYAPRVASTLRFRQSWLGTFLHPVAIMIFLALQWTALMSRMLGRPAAWKQRTYAAVHS